VLKTFKKDGLLVAMPGTIQNRTGWYEMPPDEEEGAAIQGAQVVRFEVSLEGEWALSDGPMGKAEWMQKQAEANSAKWGDKRG
jgi:hypothetical protein